MRIPCPSCSAIYEVSDALLVVTRTVRCAQCGHAWQTVPTAPIVAPEVAPAEDIAEAPAEAPVEAPVEALVEAPAKDMAAAVELTVLPSPETSKSRRLLAGLRENRVVLLGWFFSLLLLVLLGHAAINHREEIMTAWPPSQRLFALLGVPNGE